MYRYRRKACGEPLRRHALAPDHVGDAHLAPDLAQRSRRPVVTLVSSNETRVVVVQMNLCDCRIDGCLQCRPRLGRVVEVLRLGSGVGRQLAR